MAVVRQRPTPPYALIVFIVLWAASTAAFVWAFVQYGKATEQANSRQNDIKDMMSPSEQSAVNDLRRLGSANGRSAFGQAQFEIQTLQGKLAGPQYSKTGYQEALAAANAVLASGTGDQNINKDMSLTDAVRTLADDNQALRAQNNNLQEQVKSAVASYDAAKKQFDSQIASAQSSVQKLQNDLKEMTSQLASVREASNQQVSTYEQNISKLQKQTGDEKNHLIVLLNQAEYDRDQARKQVAGLKEQVNQLRPNIGLTVALQADGKIVKADSVRGDVWINLGKKDRVLPGLTFAVYDPRLGVGSGPNSGGKGSIEVVTVGDTESYARVTHLTQDQYITAGDLIANPVYSNDRQKTYHFAVVGLFDLNHDGEATPAERNRIISMITTYGGVVDDKVTSQTDFVVAGQPPLSGGASSYDMMSKEAQALLGDRKKAQTNYDAQIQEAKDLSIPVLNSNRFLAMLGYFNTAVASR